VFLPYKVRNPAGSAASRRVFLFAADGCRTIKQLYEKYFQKQFPFAALLSNEIIGSCFLQRKYSDNLFAAFNFAAAASICSKLFFCKFFLLHS